jgi:class 3 adenylate cyclase/pimeloyl-ACP methyl ester carboxylesterase
MLSTAATRAKQAPVAAVHDLREDPRVEELDIRYARSGGVAIAHLVVGDGDTDLVYVPDFMSNLVYNWMWRSWRDFYERLAQSFRLILFDKRGTGLSDHGGQFAALETRMDDLRAVLDAVGSTTAVVFGAHEGSAMAALYAATYPERVRALVLFHPGSDIAPDDPYAERELADLRDRWGTRAFSDELLRWGAPTLYGREEEREWFANELRLGASPAVAYALNRAFVETDLSEVWPAVRAPTLVLFRSGSMGEVPALEVARQIPGSRSVPVSGTDYFGLFQSLDIADEIERFVRGEQELEVPESVLATLLFTDIVASTERAAELGDRGWRELLKRHHALVRRELGRFRGEEQDTAGDGFFATFDGPARAIRCAQVVVEGVREIGLDVRVGVHTGECELHDGKVAGLAVSIGARVAAAAGAGEVLVSQTVKDLVAGTGLALEDRGERELKGVPGTWRLYAATEAASDREASGRPGA